jgi:hypothetical protein
MNLITFIYRRRIVGTIVGWSTGWSPGRQTDRFVYAYIQLAVRQIGQPVASRISSFTFRKARIPVRNIRMSEVNLGKQHPRLNRY